MTSPPFTLDRRLVMRGSIAGALAAVMPARAQEGEIAANPATISRVMQAVSEYIAGAAQRPLPDAAAEATRHHLLDTLAAMVSGARLPPGQRAIAYVKTLGGTPEACVPGTHIVTNVINSALAGGMLAHADETDDSHAASFIHPGCGIVPAALAMAEQQQASGTALLRAVALGYDIGTRIALALGAAAFAKTGHDPHAFGPMFGAASACASLARLDAQRVRYVLSYTTQQASGLSNYASDTEHVEKAFQFGGLPARNGAASATMVASGMTGHEDAFSGERNFFFAFGPKSDQEELVRGLGETYEVANTNIKRWTVGSPIQAPLDSLYDLIKVNKFTTDDVEKVVVRISHSGKRTVDDRSMPDVSLQHMVALMLIDGNVTLETAHDYKRMQNPKVLAVRKHIELVGDDDLESALPSRQAIVEVTLRDGRRLRHHTKEVRGSSRNPMTREEVGEKAYFLCAPVLGNKRAHALIETVWDIEKVRNVRSLRRLLQT
jgi:2-methylcitrate dehydratase PrpD